MISAQLSPPSTLSIISVTFDQLQYELRVSDYKETGGMYYYYSSKVECLAPAIGYHTSKIIISQGLLF